jgi:ornithine cyclodeaminase/alanine dehydrogenase-like protein (mu-crystallin family)
VKNLKSGVNMQIRILSADDVKKVLPMPKAIDAMRTAYGQLSSGQAKVPIRSQISTDKGDTLFMPAYLSETHDLGIKVVSIYGDNPGKGLPRITATVLVIDPETGLPKAFMDGSSLTAIRTGAGGGLAAELLSRQNSETVALFGAGIQARTQLQAVMAVRKIRYVYIISRTRASAQKLAEEIATWSYTPIVDTTSTPQEAIRDADIVITATTSPTPLFDGNDLKPGTHITAIGSYTPEKREVDSITAQRARIIVDSRDACLIEAGDIIIPGVEIDAEIGEIVNGDKPARQSDDEITLFKSVGIAVQDIASASIVLHEAEALGLGRVLDI